MSKDGIQAEGPGSNSFVDLGVEYRYNWISSEEEPDDTCVPTEWTTRDINTAYKRLLK